MYITDLSEQAQAVADQLSPPRIAEFEAIRDNLGAHLGELIEAGFLKPTEFFARRGWFRYFDNAFPYFIFFEVGATTFGFKIDVVLIDLILPALASQ